MTMSQPLGRLVALQFRHVAPQPGAHPTMPVLRVHLRAPDGDYYHHDLPNGDWQLNNESLQFLALWGYKPSDIGSHNDTMRDCIPDTTCVPIAPTGNAWDDTDWGLAETAMEGGQDALREADWFDADDSTKGGDDSNQSGGGGGPDPGTGNRGGVEEPSEPEEDTGVSAEMAPEESDQGVTVNVE
jgi:hypothetical protein